MRAVSATVRWSHRDDDRLACERRAPLAVGIRSRRRRRSTPSATAAGSPTPLRCSAPTSPACWCATGGWRIAASSTRRTRAVCLTCYAAARNCRRIIRTVPGAAKCRRSCRMASPCGTFCNAGDISEHRSGVGPRPTRSPGSVRLIDAPNRRVDDVRALRQAPGATNSLPCSSSMCDPSIEATNWRAEQAIRPAVVELARSAAATALLVQRCRHASRCWPASCAPSRATATSTCSDLIASDAVRPGASRPRRTRTAAVDPEAGCPNGPSLASCRLPAALTAGTGPVARSDLASVPSLVCPAWPRSRLTELVHPLNLTAAPTAADSTQTRPTADAVWHDWRWVQHGARPVAERTFATNPGRLRPARCLISARVYW